MTTSTPDLLTRCRAVLARLHHSPIIPKHGIGADVLAELDRRALTTPVSAGYIMYTTAGWPYCADPSTFTLTPTLDRAESGLARLDRLWPSAHAPAVTLLDALSDAAGEPRQTWAQWQEPPAREPTLDAGWPLGADRGVSR